MSPHISTVNVIEIIQGIIMGLWAFPSTPQGLLDASNDFMLIASENGYTEEEIKASNNHLSNRNGHSVQIVISDLNLPPD